MSISSLTQTIEAYDQYGIHRLNGVKVLYILLLLFFFNGLWAVPNPYFYFFYLPITSLTAEVIMTTLPNKYIAFIYTILGTCITIIIFAMFRPYPIFFFLSVFISTLILYQIALNKLPMMLPLVPVILSLAAYSMLYPSLNENIHMTFENLISIFIATLIILTALFLFPQSYYYRIWLRAFLVACRNIEADESPHDALKYMHQFSHMIPPTFPTFTILKINLLMHQLSLQNHITRHTDSAPWKKSLRQLMTSIQTESRYPLTDDDLTIKPLVTAWNSLCKRL